MEEGDVPVLHGVGEGAEEGEQEELRLRAVREVDSGGVDGPDQQLDRGHQQDLLQEGLRRSIY